MKKFLNLKKLSFVLACVSASPLFVIACQSKEAKNDVQNSNKATIPTHANNNPEQPQNESNTQPHTENRPENNLKNEIKRSIERNDYKMQTYNFRNTASSYKFLKNTMNLYTFPDDPTQYVDVMETILFLNGKNDGSGYKGFFNTKGIAFENENETSTEFKIGFNTSVEGEHKKFRIDWEQRKIYIPDSNVFVFPENTETTEQMTGLRELPKEIRDLDSKETVLDLGKYNINLYVAAPREGDRWQKTFMPLWLFNLIFCSPNYFNITFTGRSLYGIQFVSQPNDPNTAKIRKNKLNGATATTEQRQEVYNQLKFIIENFYGLKEIRNITNFDDFIGPENKKLLLSTDTNDNNKAYVNIIFKKLNDLHSVYHMPSFYNQPDTQVQDIIKAVGFATPESVNEILSEFNSVSKNLEDKRKELAKQYSSRKDLKYGTPNLRFEGETAFINVDQFAQLAPNNPNYEAIDTYGVMEDSIRRIKTRNEEIRTGKAPSYFVSETKLETGAKATKNVVIDLSVNNGGLVLALNRAFGLITNKPYIKYEYHVNDKILTKETYQIDTNGDREYNEKDGHPEFNYYILTSRATFSAANSFAVLAKTNKLAKIIGQKTGGGMSAILPVVLSDGTQLQLSSNNALVMVDDNQRVVYTDEGISPDIEIGYDKFYDYEFIANKIKQSQ
ncbi:S41 family peptidase [Mycoplasma sp. Ms02]|uniref:S41 family peptidase n=1 Tax=Mycoplasma sp. Ms02 TaxID=353851 RepID=UPI001C8AC506|nr:S41 family peptidase [Mycoplasma sp. Ms02]QZE12484.1 hypothetical protein K4L35_00625 [Mycoplasma sp. Ms02]